MDEAGAAADDPELPTTLVVKVKPGGGAPAPNELTSSADEAEDDDDACAWVGGRPYRIEEQELVPGGWAVLCALRSQRHINGLLVRVCGWERPLWWETEQSTSAPADASEERIYVQLVEGPKAQRVNTACLRVRATNLQPVPAEEGVGRLCHAWIDSGPSTDTFGVPVWEALRSENLRVKERGLMHNMCKKACDDRGVPCTVIPSDDVRTPKGHPGRQVLLKVKSAASAPQTDAAAGPSSDLRQMPFVELCTLLEALEAVDHSVKGFNQRRLQMLEIFWRKVRTLPCNPCTCICPAGWAPRGAPARASQPAIRADAAAAPAQ